MSTASGGRVFVSCEYFACGKVFAKTREPAYYSIVRRSRGLDPEIARRIMQMTPLRRVDDVARMPVTYGIFPINGKLLALRRYYPSPAPDPSGAYFMQDDTLVVQRSDLLELGGNFRPLFKRLPPLPTKLYTARQMDCPPLEGLVRIPTPREQQDLYTRVMCDTGGNMFFLLLQGLLQPERLAILGAPEDAKFRLDLIECLLLCLPPAVRTELSAITWTRDPTAPTMVKFLQDDPGEEHNRAIWNKWVVETPAGPALPAGDYSQLLRRFLAEYGLPELLARVERMVLPEGMELAQVREFLPGLARRRVGLPFLKRDVERMEAGYAEIVNAVRADGALLPPEDLDWCLRNILEHLLAGHLDVPGVELVAQHDPNATLKPMLEQAVDRGEWDSVHPLYEIWARMPKLAEAWRGAIGDLIGREFHLLVQQKRAGEIALTLQRFFDARLDTLLPDGGCDMVERAAVQDPERQATYLAMLLPRLATKAKVQALLDRPLGAQLRASHPGCAQLLEALASGASLRVPVQACLAELDHVGDMVAFAELGLNLQAGTELYPPLLQALVKSRSKKEPPPEPLIRWVLRLATDGPIEQLPVELQWVVLFLIWNDNRAIMRVLDAVAHRGVKRLDNLLVRLMDGMESWQVDQRLRKYSGLLDAGELGMEGRLRLHIGLAFLSREPAWDPSLSPFLAEMLDLAEEVPLEQVSVDDMQALLTRVKQAQELPLQRREQAARLGVCHALCHDAEIAAAVVDWANLRRTAILSLESKPAREAAADKYETELAQLVYRHWQPPGADQVIPVIEALEHADCRAEALAIEKALLDAAVESSQRRSVAGQLFAERVLEFEYLMALFSGLAERDTATWSAGVTPALSSLVVDGWPDVEDQFKEGWLGGPAPEWLRRLRNFVGPLSEPRLVARQGLGA